LEKNAWQLQDTPALYEAREFRLVVEDKLDIAVRLADLSQAMTGALYNSKHFSGANGTLLDDAAA
jgi:hypothetical protein